MKEEHLKMVERDTWKVIEAKHTCFDGSNFVNLGAERMYFENVSLAGTKITNANLSNIEIDGAQMGGSYIHNIGIPQVGDPHYNQDTAGKPIRFENCELIRSTITNCDLSNVEINDCKLDDMKINGILVEDLLRAYRNSRSSNS